MIVFPILIASGNAPHSMGWPNFEEKRVMSFPPYFAEYTEHVMRESNLVLLVFNHNVFGAMLNDMVKNEREILIIGIDLVVDHIFGVDFDGVLFW